MKRFRGRLQSARFMGLLGFRSAPGWMCTYVALQLLLGAANALSPYGIRVFVDAVTVHSDSKLIEGVVLFAITTVAGRAAIIYSVNGGQVLTQWTDLYLKMRIAELINHLPGIEHFERPTYLREVDLLTFRRRQLAVAPMQVYGLVSVITRLVIVVVLLASVNPLFVALLALALVPMLSNSLGVRIRQRADNDIADDMRLANSFFELAATAGPAKELRSFGLSKELGGRHERLVGQILARSDRSAFQAMLVEILGWVVFGGAFIAFLAIVITQGIHGHITLGALVMTILLLQQAQTQIGGAARTAGGIQQAKQAADRYVWLENYEKEQTSSLPRAVTPDHLAGGITFDHVSFTYPGTDVKVLDDISFEVPAGTTVALIGENGAGKTTVVKLMSALYRPSEGVIRVDGVDLSELDPLEWRRRISATFQDFVNFELRAGSAVGIGDLLRSEDDSAVVAALNRVSAGGIVEELDQGLETLLGSSHIGGRELSGGQWQKLALGRGRMREVPLLLLLDEPTASLDATTEHAIFEYYVSTAREAADNAGAVTVIVSHRFSTVRSADIVIVLEHGRIAEMGSHDDLMASRGLYAELFSLQERGYR